LDQVRRLVATSTHLYLSRYYYLYGLILLNKFCAIIPRTLKYAGGHNSYAVINLMVKEIHSKSNAIDDLELIPDVSPPTNFIKAGFGKDKPVPETVSTEPSNSIDHEVPPDLIDLSLLSVLRDAGVGTDIDLPRIAVIGKQSSGKSSVIESLTGIELPRAAGTCTRCPIEVTIQRDETVDWSCTISFRWQYDPRGQPFKSAKVSNDFIKLSNPIEFCKGIRDAQVTLLNGSAFIQYEDNNDKIRKWQNGGEFLSGHAKFTKNQLVIKIKGRNVPAQSLQLIDLPGLIQATDNQEDEFYIDLIKDLAQQYIRPLNTIILQCLTCEDDIENQAARTLAREADPNGSRSIAVLTKPDRIQEGTEKDWLDVMINKRYKIAYGYYVLKNRDQMQVQKGLTAAQSRIAEAKFFQQNKLIGIKINELEPTRCGAINLRSRLSELLQVKFQEQFPALVKTIMSKYKTNKENLDNLPKSILADDVDDELLMRLKEFDRRFGDMVYTQGGEGSLIYDVYDTHDTLKRAMEYAVPSFAWESPSDLDIKKWVKFTDQGEDTEKYLIDWLPDWDNRRQFKKYSEKDIKTKIDNVRGRDLQVFGSPGAYRVGLDLTKSAINDWNIALKPYVDKLKDIILKHMKNLMEDKFAGFPNLQKEIKKVLENILEEQSSIALTELRRLWQLEKGLDNRHRFQTLNQHYIQNNVVASIGRSIKEGMRGKSGFDICKQIREVDQVMALSQGCFKVAYKRSLDFFMMSADSNMLQEVEKKLFKTLFKKILSGKGKVELLKLVEDDKSVVTKREQLEAVVKRQKLGIDLLKQHI